MRLPSGIRHEDRPKSSGVGWYGISLPWAVILVDDTTLRGECCAYKCKQNFGINRGRCPKIASKSANKTSQTSWKRDISWFKAQPYLFHLSHRLKRCTMEKSGKWTHLYVPSISFFVLKTFVKEALAGKYA